MDSFFAFIKKYYTNFWTRNGFLIAIALTFSLLSNSFQPVEARVNPVNLVILGIANIGLIILYNHFILRLFLFKNRFVPFLLLFAAHIAVITLFTMYVTRYLLGKPFVADFMPFLPDVVFNTFLISFFTFYTIIFSAILN